jgi:hypothetical protein
MVALVSKGPQRRTLWFGLFFFCVLIFSYLKGINPSVQIWGEFYWYVDYSYGFIRRGLIGELMIPIRWLTGQLGGDYSTAIIVTYQMITLGLLAALAAWAAAIAGRLGERRTIPFGLGAALFFASPVVPIVAFNTGYVDSIMMVGTACAALCLVKRFHLMAAAIGVAMTLCNEAALFLWLPLMVLIAATWRLRDPGERITAALAALAPTIGLAAIVVFERHGAAAAIIESLPFAPGVERKLIENQYGQAALPHFLRQVRRIAEFRTRFGLSMLYTQAPTLLITLLVINLVNQSTREAAQLVRLRPTQRVAFCFAFAFAPFLLLLFSWDLTRMMSWTNFSAGLLLLLASERIAYADRMP